MKPFLLLLGLCWLAFPYSGNAQTVSQKTSTSSVCDAAKIQELIQQGRSEKKAKDFDAAIITFKVDINMATGQPSKNLLPDVQKYFKEKLGLSLKTSDEAVADPKVIAHI